MAFHRLPGYLGNGIDVARESVSISDCRQPDMPLIYVNKGFERVTGYLQDEVLGRNCRFLQGALHDQPGVQQMRTAIKAREACLVEITNVRKDGSRFLNRLSLRPVFGKTGTMTFIIGLQHDVTPLRDLEEMLVRRLQAVGEGVPA